MRVWGFWLPPRPFHLLLFKGGESEGNRSEKFESFMWNEKHLKRPKNFQPPSQPPFIPLLSTPTTKVLVHQLVRLFVRFSVFDSISRFGIVVRLSRPFRQNWGLGPRLPSRRRSLTDPVPSLQDGICTCKTPGQTYLPLNGSILCRMSKMKNFRRLSLL